MRVLAAVVVVGGLLSGCTGAGSSPEEAASEACEEALAVPPVGSRTGNSYQAEPEELEAWAETLESAAESAAAAASGDSAYDELSAGLEATRDDFAHIRDALSGGNAITGDELAAIEDRAAALVDVCQRAVGVGDGEGDSAATPGSVGETPTAGCPGDDFEACVAAAEPVSMPPEMCAEFPPGTGGTGPSYEGWWSSTPLTDGGEKVQTDASEWPPVMREHPRTVLVDTRTGKVIESFDRYTCSSIADYAIPAGLELPSDAVVVLDADTGETLETMSPPAFEPQG